MTRLGRSPKNRRRSLDRTYEELKLEEVVSESPHTIRLDRTYEELKHVFGGFVIEASGVWIVPMRN